ncbi:MAG TPA: TolC family protein [Holophagaceae bacterium]|nr:TolC family protein [Holophagaceae bacterium]
MIHRLLLPLSALPLLVAPLGAYPGTDAQDLSLPEALRSAWSKQSGLQAGQAMVDRARLDSEAASAMLLPTLQAQAGWMRTDEPMMAFGMKLNQARIQASDFNPASLNHPDAVSGLGGSLTLQQPLYAGGRITAARKATNALASAEAAQQAHRKQQVALAVVQAYFGAQAAAAGVTYAEDTLKTAQGTEAFVAARVDQGLMLKADLARVKAWRAQAEAGLAEARRQEASARSGLALLMGAAAPAHLTTALETPVPAAGPSGQRADLRAASLQTDAARAYAQAVGGSLKPEVGLNLTVGTARETFGAAGGSWTTASIGAKWTFAFGDTKKTQAARAGARAAELAQRWQQAQAARETTEAEGAVTTAEAKVRAAAEGLAAAEEARELRQARHREGLLPLTELLDAESALAGARAFRLATLLELRTAHAQRALALGTPIEGVTE